MLRWVWALIVLVGLIGLLPASVNAQSGDNRAALVVSYGDGRVETQCVSFSETEITGEELLQRTDLTITMDYSYGLGAAICSINGQGCAYPQEDCFCKCQGASCQFWAYYHWNGTAWQFSSTGASYQTVKNGTLVGWTWGSGSTSSGGVVPPAVTFDHICTAPTSTPTVTPTATATPSPTPSPTATPTATATPTPSTQTTSSPAVASPPEVLFEAAASTLTAGACTVLRWVTWDAQQVTLDGAAVVGQDRREVCPQKTQRYVLAASNAGGETRREVTIAVAGTVGPPAQAATPSATPQPALGSNAHTSPLPTPVAASARAGSASPAPVPTSASVRPESKPLLSVAQALPPATATGADVPIAPKVAAPAVASPALSSRPTPTPQPSRLAQRRALAPGQPTPTPMLVARADPGGSPSRSSGGSASASTQPTASPERGFRMALLPGYAAYALMAAMLVGTGVVVVRRKQHA